MENNGHREFRHSEPEDSVAPNAALLEAVSIRSMSLVILTSIFALFFIDWGQWGWSSLPLY